MHISRKQQKWFIIGLIVLIVCFAFYFTLSAKDKNPDLGQDLIINGDFNEADEGWIAEAFISTEGYSSFEVRFGEGINGTNALYIENLYLNDARYYQEVAVSPNTLYHLHGFIKADAEQGLGANLSVEGIYVFSNSVYDSQNEWQEVSLFGRTGEEQTSLKVFARLGGYSGESVGKAWFNNVSLEKADHVPDGFFEYKLYSTEETMKEGSLQKNSSLVFVLIIIIYSFLFVLLKKTIGTCKNNDISLMKNGGIPEYIPLLLILIAASLVRVFIGIRVTGYDVDIIDFMSWASRMASGGPVGFYSSDVFCDYPPGYMLVLWPLGLLGQWIGMSPLLIKLPSIICDLILAFILYRYMILNGKSVKAALAVCSLAAVNPVSILFGSAWGQTDSVMTLFIIITLLYAMQHRWDVALPSYVFAILLKPQALMFGPLGLAALVFDVIRFIKHKEDQTKDYFFRSILKGIVFSIILAIVVILPFSIRQGGIGWLFGLYGNTMGQYAYATVNACNAYFIFGLNWVSAKSTISDHGGIMLVLCMLTVFFAPCIISAFRGTKSKTIKITFLCFVSIVSIILILLMYLTSLTLTQLSYAFLFLYVFSAIVLFVNARSIKHLPLLGGSLLCLIFSNMTMMHERYLFPAIMLFFLAYIVEKDRRILWLMLAVTAASFLNAGCVLDRNIRIGGAEGHLDAPYFGISSDMSILEYASSAIEMICTAFSVYISCDICLFTKKAKDFKTAESCGSQTNDNPNGSYELYMFEDQNCQANRKLDIKDWVIMVTVTIVYACFSFFNLGSTMAPQTSYTFMPDSPPVIIDLGEEHTFSILYYGGIHNADTTFTIEIGNNIDEWASIQDSNMMIGDCFKWQYVTAGISEPKIFTGRYIRIQTLAPGLTLYEVIFRDTDGNTIPVLHIDGEENCNNLVDEQDVFSGEPDWFNSMYFDEIYHARTGYELLHGMNVYEWTHPPLGKDIMALMIMIFGMTPFGWRAAGNIMGIMMLPGMYMLGKQLFKKRYAALYSMLFMAFDLMHFTQTRIATIDSFVVCFIIWSYVFMLKYFFMDFSNIKRIKTFIPLGLSGVFIGLAIASKWTGCYAGVGLAVIFFFKIVRRYRYLKAKIQKSKHDGTQINDDPIINDIKNENKLLIYHILSCFVFFILIPVVIYFLSYLPFFANRGGASISKIINECKNMFSYHSTPNLGMDHPFYSPWYEWPLSIKPMWYFSASYAEIGSRRVIFAMGNPAVWWIGILTMIALIMFFIQNHLTKEPAVTLRVHRNTPEDVLIIIAFLAQFLPWVLVPRGTYIYHYFTSIPFVILSIVRVWESIRTHNPSIGKLIMITHVVTAAILFGLFFPYASGITAPKGWFQAMNWFQNWLYY